MKPLALADLDPGESVLLDPPTRVNFNVPNFALAFASAETGIRVVDQHTLPFPGDRVLSARERVVVLSARPHTLGEAKRIADRVEGQGRRALSLQGSLDVQCCYPFVTLGDTVATPTPFSDALPLPRYERFDSYNYMSTNWGVGLWPYPLLTSVGCPFGCTFCAARQRRWRGRSPEHCVEELQRAVRDHRIRRFEVLDDLFNLETPRLERFCQLVQPLGLTWSCANGLRADRFDEDQARALARAGCDRVGFGIESIDPEVLRGIRKGETREQMEQAVDIARRYFRVVFAYLILGLPGSSYASDAEGLHWALGRGVIPNLSYYVPDRLASDHAFFGGGSRPVSGAYPVRLQRRVYRLGREAKRRGYQEEGLIRRGIWATLEALPRYDWRGLVTHVMISSRQALQLALRGEIQ